MEMRVKTAAIICPNKRNISLNTLYMRNAANTAEIEPPHTYNSPKTANQKPNLMLILSRGSLCFIFFTVCTIFMTFFYSNASLSRRSSIVSGQ